MANALRVGDDLLGRLDAHVKTADQPVSVDGSRRVTS
jgi:hypothetical protein